MMGDIRSGLWLDRLGKIAAIMIVGAFILTLLSAEFWMRRDLAQQVIFRAAEDCTIPSCCPARDRFDLPQAQACAKGL